jgi:hypothetical protein
VSRPPSAKTEPEGAPNDEALSRIAREAVHQPADPRLDRQLERLGVMDPPESGGSSSRRSSNASASTGAELERLSAKIGRIQTMVWVLAVIVGIVVVVEVVQLLR